MQVLGVCGSPRRGGNTELLLKELLRGSKDAGAQTEEILLRDLKVTPCLEIYACKKDGQCPIPDDMQPLYVKLTEVDALVLASPIFFYTVSAHTKAFIDRCQAMWARKYLLKLPIAPGKLAVGGTKGTKLFDGALLTVKYFLDALDMTLYRSLLYPSIDAKGDIIKHPTAMAEAYALGRELAQEK